MTKPMLITDRKFATSDEKPIARSALTIIDNAIMSAITPNTNKPITFNPPPEVYIVTPQMGQMC